MTGKTTDITDPKRVEQELTEANERLRLVMEAGSAAGWEFDLKTGKNLWFGKAHAQLGMTPDETSGSRMEFWNRVHEEDREGLKHALEVAREKREDFMEDFRVVWRDGTTHWLRSRGRFHYTGEGEAERLLGISLDITERKQSEDALWEMNRTLEAQSSLLRSREELLRVFVKNVPAAVAMLDHDMRYLQVSDRWCTDYLRGRAEIIGHSHYEIFPDMPERWKEVHRRALQGETLRAEEDRWDGQDGTHWARWEVRPWNTPDGAVGGILILTEDITHRKQMEEALSDLSRKLIESQEQEGARIGRELHDNICQHVALLAIRLGQLKASPNGLPDEIKNQLSKMETETAELSRRIQQLSRELHPPTLEFLGLREAIRSWCDEFSEKWNFEIVFEDDDAPTCLPSEISLNLFRVLQEALNNAAKYSGVERFDVRLWGSPAEIHLSVTDHGKGFDISSTMRGRGIGLKSMRERAKLMNGHLTIESKPNQGTKIHACVPIEE